MIAGVIALGLAMAVPADVPTVGLFGSVSGFAKARTDRVAITVGPMPGGETDRLQWILDVWNEAAGWELFTIAPDSRAPDVQFLENADETCPNYAACTGWDQFDTGWYKHCYIMLPARGADDSTVTHELGHCLGFQDVPTTDTGYLGIMSYARDRANTTPANNPHDLASLEAVGYRD